MGEAFLQPGQVDFQAEEEGPDIVVDLARYRGPLGFLDSFEVRGEFADLAFGVLEVGDLVEDAVPQRMRFVPLEEGGRKLQPALGGVPWAAAAALERQVGARGSGLGDAREQCRAVLRDQRVKQRRRILAQYLRRNPEHALRAFARIGQPELAGLPVVVEAEHHGGQVGRKRMERGVPLAQGGLGQPLGAPRVCGIDRAGNGRDESRQVALHDEVVGAAEHRIHRRLLADRPGHHDQRDLRVVFLQHAQRPGQRKARQLVVRDDQVPVRASQRGAHFGFGLDPLQVRVEPLVGKPQRQQVEIAFGVLDDEDADRGVQHGNSV